MRDPHELRNHVALEMLRIVVEDRSEYLFDDTCRAGTRIGRMEFVVDNAFQLADAYVRKATKDARATLTCQHCGNSFVGTRSHAKYCSPTCRVAASQLRTGADDKAHT